jgi:hypothetical protein
MGMTEGEVLQIWNRHLYSPGWLLMVAGEEVHLFSQRPMVSTFLEPPFWVPGRPSSMASFSVPQRSLAEFPVFFPIRLGMTYHHLISTSQEEVVVEAPGGMANCKPLQPSD